MSALNDVLYGNTKFSQSSFRRLNIDTPRVEVVIHSPDLKIKPVDLDEYKFGSMNNYNKKTIVATIVATVFIIFGVIMKSTFAVSATTVLCFLAYSQKHLFRTDRRRHLE